MFKESMQFFTDTAVLVLKIYKKKYCTNGLSEVLGKQSSIKYQCTHLHPGNYILN